MADFPSNLAFIKLSEQNFIFQARQAGLVELSRNGDDSLSLAPAHGVKICHFSQKLR